MPIEIKELHINVIVNEEDDSRKTDVSSAEPSAGQLNAIVAECVEQVLNILKEKQER